ncbi:MAG: hypothetical protein CL608_22035 [Anaerolineaceae bacterium]|nr:hypothetical protein [Anaerolineaceae bacterium]
MFACRTEQPEAQIVMAPTPTSTAVSTPSATPTQPPPTPPAEITPTPPTTTPSFLPTRPTVGDFISEAGIFPTGLDVDVLEQRVIAFEPLNSERSFLLGYFVDTPEGSELPDELHFLRFDKATQSWWATTLQEPERPVGEACHPSVCYRLGVITDYLETPSFYFVYMHGNPSAGWTAVLTPELELNTVLYGRVRAVFTDGTAVYDESIIHFAPTHYALVNIYNPNTQESRRIFPPEPYQPLWLARQELVAQTYEALGEDWCRENNHHCDPELFNNGISSDVVVNDETDSLAFVITFSAEFILDLPNETAVYIYRGVRNGDLQFREASEAELTQLFGSYELADLLEADRLETIFTEVTFIEEEPAE